MKYMGLAKYISRLEIHRDRSKRTLHINQHKYVLDILKQLNMKVSYVENLRNLM